MLADDSEMGGRSEERGKRKGIHAVKLGEEIKRVVLTPDAGRRDAGAEELVLDVSLIRERCGYCTTTIRSLRSLLNPAVRVRSRYAGYTHSAPFSP